MAGKELFAGERFRLPTNQLWTVGTKSGVVPAFNNVYDVWIDFNSAFNDDTNDNSLASFINLYAMNSNLTDNPGDYLALFCSEAVLPATNIEVSSVRGLRQGIAQGYAAYRSFPDVTLTFYSQRDYFTNDVFNAWTEYISPTHVHGTTKFGESTKDRMNDKFAYRKIKYPNTYKCDMKITAFTRDVVSKWDRLYKNGHVEVPNSIQYTLMNAFPVSVVASPLAYGDAELLKTTVTFNYETYYTDRTKISYQHDSPDTLSFFDKDGNYTGDQLNGIDKMNTPLGLNFGYTEESDENQIRTPFAEDKELVESISFFDKDGNFIGDQ